MERWPQQEGFLGWRTRAFAYLLLDGPLRSGAAIWLNIEEVVKDPAASRIQVLEEAVLRPCEGNKYQARPFGMTDRAREAIADYLKVARSEGWLASGRLEGALWIASQPRGTQQRMSQRTAAWAWQAFVQTVPGLSRDEYQLEDLVLTGRVAFLKAAKGNVDLMSDHAGLSGQHIGKHYSDHLSSPSSKRDVLSQMSQAQKKRRG